ncbi:MAG: beta-propeller fold lactonase family protein [Planctomycetes bacterium]|nr:beta-propeller fold lactonase family protein [Planctomycetota bacterium]
MSVRCSAVLFSTACALVACGGGGGGAGANPPAGLSYSAGSVVYEVCAPIVANVPALNAGHATHFEVAPPLPSGLVIDPSSGVIQGAPTSLASSTTHTVTASNSAGSASTDIVVEVVAVNLAGLDYGAASIPFAFGVTSRYAPELASGTAGDWSVVSGALPAGIALDPLTGELSGKPPHALAGTNSSVTIRARNCLGASTQVALSITVDRPVARAAYLLNDAEPVLSTYSFDRDTGLLRSHGTALTVDAASGELVVSPDGRFVFVAEGDYAAVRAFRTEADSAGLVDAGLVVSTGEMPAVALGVHPASTHLYAATNAGLVAQYAIDSLSGALTPLAPATVSTGDEPAALAVDPLGRFVFVAHALEPGVSSYSIESGSGRLLASSSVDLSVPPTSLAVSPNGAYLVVGTDAAAELHVYSIHPASGALAPVAGSPFATPGGTSPSQVACAPSGEQVYVAHAFQGAIDAFDWTPGGALVPLAIPTTTLTRPASRVVLEPSGSNLLALVEGVGWFGFVPGGDGVLHEAQCELVVGRVNSRALAFQPATSAFQVAIESAYVGSADGRIYQFGVDGSGALTALTPAFVAASSTALHWIEAHPTLDLALVVSSDTTPARFVIDASGALSLDSSGSTLSTSRSVHIDAAGRYAYEVRDGAPATIQPYSIDSATGALTALAPIEVSDGPRALALHPNGRFLYLPCSAADLIDVLEVDWATGELAAWPSTVTGDAPTRLAINDAGTHLVCLESGTATVVVYAIDAADGALELLPGGVNALGLGPTTLAIDAFGEHVFVAGAGGSALRAYTLDAASGALSFTGYSLVGTALQAVRVDASGARLFATRANGTLARIEYDSSSGFTLVQSLAAGVPPAEFALRTQLR